MCIIVFQFHLLSLKELYCEGNGLVPCKPVPLLQNTEVLSLKVKLFFTKLLCLFLKLLFGSNCDSTVSLQELVARFVLLEDRKQFSLIHLRLLHYPDLSNLLASSRCCAVCQGPFLTAWLECLHFISLKKVRVLLYETHMKHMKYRLLFL